MNRHTRKPALPMPPPQPSKEQIPKEFRRSHARGKENYKAPPVRRHTFSDNNHAVSTRSSRNSKLGASISPLTSLDLNLPGGLGTQHGISKHTLSSNRSYVVDNNAISMFKTSTVESEVTPLYQDDVGLLQLVKLGRASTKNVTSGRYPHRLAPQPPQA